MEPPLKKTCAQETGCGIVKYIRSYLRKRQQQSHIVKNYFLGEHVRYASA